MIQIPTYSSSFWQWFYLRFDWNLTSCWYVCWQVDSKHRCWWWKWRQRRKLSCVCLFIVLCLLWLIHIHQRSFVWRYFAGYSSSRFSYWNHHKSGNLFVRWTLRVPGIFQSSWTSLGFKCLDFRIQDLNLSSYSCEHCDVSWILSWVLRSYLYCF